MEVQSSKAEEIKKEHQSQISLQKNTSKFSNSIYFKIKSFFRTIFFQNNENHFLRALDDIIDQCVKRSFLSAEEQKMINNIIKIDDIKVSDVMIPRADIIAMSKKSSLEEIKDMIIEKEHTRMPIYGENLDEIVGFIHSKDLVKFLSKNKEEFDLKSLIRKVIYVPHSMRIIDLLRKMRFSRVHIAIVLDEYSGVDGLVTLEDIMEEIVGEIEDEHDLPDNNLYTKINKISDNIFHVGGRVEIEEIENILSIKILEENLEEVETIGGFILAKMKKVPQTGEVLTISDNLSLKILESDLRSIKLIEINYSG